MNKKLNKKKVIILIAIVLLIIAIISIVKISNNTTSKIQNVTNPSEEMLNNISYEYCLGKEGKFILKLTNNNKNANLIGLKVNVQFYNEEELLGESIKYLYMLEANKEYEMGMYSHILDENLLNEKNIKVSIAAQENATYEIDNSKIEIITNEENGILKLEAKNNTDKTVELQADVVFYKEGKAVTASEWSDLIAKGQSKTKEITKTLDMFGSEIEYDSYKVYYNAMQIVEEQMEVQE